MQRPVTGERPCEPEVPVSQRYSGSLGIGGAEAYVLGRGVPPRAASSASACNVDPEQQPAAELGLAVARVRAQLDHARARPSPSRSCVEVSPCSTPSASAARAASIAATRAAEQRREGTRRSTRR